MAHYRSRDVAHVVGSGKLAAANSRQRFCAQKQRHRSARTRTVVNERMHTRASHQVNRVALYAWLHARLAHLAATARNRIRVYQRLNINFVQSPGIKSCVPVCHHLSLLLLTGIIEENLQHKTIELSLRERIGPLILNRFMLKIFLDYPGEEQE